MRSCDGYVLMFKCQLWEYGISNEVLEVVLLSQVTGTPLSCCCHIYFKAINFRGMKPPKKKPQKKKKKKKKKKKL